MLVGPYKGLQKPRGIRTVNVGAQTRCCGGSACAPRSERGVGGGKADAGGVHRRLRASNWGTSGTKTPRIGGFAPTSALLGQRLHAEASTPSSPDLLLCISHSRCTQEHRFLGIGECCFHRSLRCTTCCCGLCITHLLWHQAIDKSPRTQPRLLVVNAPFC